MYIAACLLLASLAPGAADPAPAIHYAPIENLEHVDVALIDRAGTQFAEREPAKVFLDLAETPGVEIRIKHETNAPMHLKS